MGAVASAVESAVSSAASAVATAVEDVGHAVENVGHAVEKDPLGTLATVVTAVVAPELLPLVAATNTLAHGGSIENAVINAGISYVGGEIGAGIGDFAGSTAVGNLAAAEIKAAAKGQDLLTAGVGSLINQGIGAGIDELGDLEFCGPDICTGDICTGDICTGDVCTGGCTSNLPETGGLPSECVTGSADNVEGGAMPCTPSQPADNVEPTGTVPTDTESSTGTDVTSYCGCVPNVTIYGQPEDCGCGCYEGCDSCTIDSGLTTLAQNESEACATCEAGCESECCASCCECCDSGGSKFKLPGLKLKLGQGAKGSRQPRVTGAKIGKQFGSPVGSSGCQAGGLPYECGVCIGVPWLCRTSETVGYKSPYAKINQRGAAPMCNAYMKAPQLGHIGECAQCTGYMCQMEPELANAFAQHGLFPANRLEGQFATGGNVASCVSSIDKNAPTFYRQAASTIDTRITPKRYPVMPQLKQIQQRISPLGNIGGYAKGGLPDRYKEAAPEGHNPEFITGLTGFYADGEGTGQSDDIPAMLHDGDYVIDAETVAQLGDGSSKAGRQVLDGFRDQIPHRMATGGQPVPAQIADGEYVLPASFVSSLGQGDNKRGAKLLDQMRKELRMHKRSAPIGKIPPKAKSPLDYMKKAKG